MSASPVIFPLHDMSMLIAGICLAVCWFGFWISQHANEKKVTGWTATLGMIGPLLPLLIYGLFFAK